MEVVVLLRGINVSGHHLVPMAQLKELLNTMGFLEVRTWLNSGNVVMRVQEAVMPDLEEVLEQQLKERFGFPIPVMVVALTLLKELVANQPFQAPPLHPHIRHYVSFLKYPPEGIPRTWGTEEDVFNVINTVHNMVFSVLDLSKMPTTKGMDLLEKRYGKLMTTRNWNTIEKLVGL